MINKKNKTVEQTDKIVQAAVENLNLSAKKATTFAKQARALQQNLSLRQKQKAARENAAKINSDETSN